MSALIWLAIVGVWGFVLIPMWLRHHDGSLEQRSADKFSTAMRVLSRRGGRAGEELDDEFEPDTDLVGGGLVGDVLADAHLVDVDSPVGDHQAAGVLARPAAGGGGQERARERTAGGEPPHARAGARAAGGPARAPDGPDETAHTVPVGAPRPAARARRADARARALRRLRRQRLGVLIAAVPVTIALAVVLAGMWVVVQLLVDVGLGLYLARLRRAARTERRLAASRAARDQRIAPERSARRAHRRPAARPGVPAAHAGRPQVSTGQRGRPASPEYAPVRLSGDPAPLSEEELATAQAETVDLGGYVTPAAGESWAGPAALDAGAGAPAPAADDGYPNNVRLTPPRPTGRPNVRPPTSRPGRVQVNPPGTHGGLTASPAASPAVAPPAAGPPAAGQPAGGQRTEPEADVRVLRRAVGG
jgi:hypothetical protein